jgi:hypothetical protein
MTLFIYVVYFRSPLSETYITLLCNEKIELKFFHITVRMEKQQIRRYIQGLSTK